jgi:hypothetical protein
VSTELGVGDTVSTNPPAVEVLLADAEGATFLALVSPGVGTPAWSCVTKLSCVRCELRETTHMAD